MAYKNKTYICFDADTDIHYYRLMQARKKHEDIDFNFYDAHDLNNIWSGSNDETIKRNLHERLSSAKNFIVLIGDNTKNLYKFVRREMEIALKLNLPIIGVNLNGIKVLDMGCCPPIIRNELVLYTTFGAKIIQRALDIWEPLHYEFKNNEKTGSHYLKDSVYDALIKK